MANFDGEILVDRIRNICKQKGISIAQMEKDLKWSQGLISRWTKNSPSVYKIMDVVRYLDVGYEELLGQINLAEDIHSENYSFTQKLYEVTVKGGLEWELWNVQFPNEDIERLISEEGKKVYYSSYENGYFLLIVCEENEGCLEVGAIYGENGRILYQDEEIKKWKERLLEQVDQKEYIIWNELKTTYFIRQFMRTDFDIK